MLARVFPCYTPRLNRHFRRSSFCLHFHLRVIKIFPSWYSRCFQYFLMTYFLCSYQGDAFQGIDFVITSFFRLLLYLFFLVLVLLKETIWILFHSLRFFFTITSGNHSTTHTKRAANPFCNTTERREDALQPRFSSHYPGVLQRRWRCGATCCSRGTP